MTEVDDDASPLLKAMMYGMSQQIDQYVAAEAAVTAAADAIVKLKDIYIPLLDHLTTKERLQWVSFFDAKVVELRLEVWGVDP